MTISQLDVTDAGHYISQGTFLADARNSISWPLSVTNTLEGAKAGEGTRGGAMLEVTGYGYDGPRETGRLK